MPKYVIGDITVEVIDVRPTVGEYTIYAGKIWRVTSYFGSGSGNCKILERSLYNERIKVANTEKLMLVVNPTHLNL